MWLIESFIVSSEWNVLGVIGLIVIMILTYFFLFHDIVLLGYNPLLGHFIATICTQKTWWYYNELVINSVFFIIIESSNEKV